MARVKSSHPDQNFPIERKSTPVTLGTVIEPEVPEVWYGLSDPLDPTRSS